jgi:hypothetical protein
MTHRGDWVIPVPGGPEMTSGIAISLSLHYIVSVTYRFESYGSSDWMVLTFTDDNGNMEEITVHHSDSVPVANLIPEEET